MLVSNLHLTCKIKADEEKRKALSISDVSSSSTDSFSLPLSGEAIFVVMSILVVVYIQGAADVVVY